MNPIDNPEAYEAIVLAGERSPGLVKLSFPSRDEGWDKQKGKGDSGAETVHNGTDLTEFAAEFFLWREGDVDHFARWDAWRPLLSRPIAKNASRALDIYHPQLDEIGVSSVVVKSWAPPQPDGKGGSTAKVTFLQYSPPKPKAAGKPKGSAASKEGAKEVDPNQDVKDEVKRLDDELRSGGPS